LNFENSGPVNELRGGEGTAACWGRISEPEEQQDANLRAVL
jgi:hypothetical protein